MNTLLSIKNLKKNYHDLKNETCAIKNITLDIYDKEWISIVGPSGCGKTSLLSILANLEEKSNGEIKYTKDNIKIGYMLQKDALFPWKTVLENCLIGLKINKKITKTDIEKVKKLLITYGLKDFINKYPNSLSGGMRQRVALIRTLVTNPDILLLDEPYSSLDYQTRLILADDLHSIIKKEGKTVILVTHDIAEAISLSNRVIVLSKRPATIKSIYKINLNNKPSENRKDKDFYTYYDKIWSDLDVYI